MKSTAEKIVWIIVGLIVVFAAIGTISFAVFGRNGMYPHGTDFVMGGFPIYAAYIVMPIMAAVSILVVFLFLYFIIVVFRRTETLDHNSTKAEEILKERYARGEISLDEYKSMIEHIK
ncbi:SHOCT domain-containing protein [Oxyplasma meridianum]|uniref:SHOCT domain-containing protein n=1 Tax=Oxyplasma meridianum TaxID=3073602 RepID=A0AAX4NIG4_9ARCH